MKVKDLIKELESMPPDFDVWVSVWNVEEEQSDVSTSVTEVQQNGVEDGKPGGGYQSITIIGE